MKAAQWRSRDQTPYPTIHSAADSAASAGSSGSSLCVFDQAVLDDNLLFAVAFGNFSRPDDHECPIQARQNVRSSVISGPADQHMPDTLRSFFVNFYYNRSSEVGNPDRKLLQ